MDSEDIFVITVLAFIGLVLGLMICVTVLNLIGIHIETGRGEHTGYVTALSRGGIFFKTDTIYVKTNTTSSQEDAYCVTDPEVYDQLQKYSISNQHVNLYFFTWFSNGIASCSNSGDVIYKVEPLTN
ncbi:MAG: hypothetical protein KGL39_48875 [Patescibacteria group bacterium]|nr:hypothetical protein [Patescibacteria group bacterium]